MAAVIVRPFLDDCGLGDDPAAEPPNNLYHKTVAERSKFYLQTTEWSSLADAVDLLIGWVVTPTVAGSSEIPSGPLPGDPKRLNRVLPNGMTIAQVISFASEKTGVNARLIAAVMKLESDFDPKAISHDKHGRPVAFGLMQIIRSTFAGLTGEVSRVWPQATLNIMDPVTNTLAGAIYLRDLLKGFGGSAPLVLASFNVGAGIIKSKGNKIPQVYHAPNGNTEHPVAYVERVMGWLQMGKVPAALQVAE